MSKGGEEETTVEGDLHEMLRLVELLDKAAANVRQLVYKLRPLLRAEIEPDEMVSRGNGDRRRRGQRREQRTERT